MMGGWSIENSLKQTPAHARYGRLTALSFGDSGPSYLSPDRLTAITGQWRQVLAQSAQGSLEMPSKAVPMMQLALPQGALGQAVASAFNQLKAQLSSLKEEPSRQGRNQISVAAVDEDEPLSDDHGGSP